MQFLKTRAAQTHHKALLEPLLEPCNVVSLPNHWFGTDPAPHAHLAWVPLQDQNQKSWYHHECRSQHSAIVSVFSRDEIRKCVHEMSNEYKKKGSRLTAGSISRCKMLNEILVKRTELVPNGMAQNKKYEYHPLKRKTQALHVCKKNTHPWPCM